MQLSHIIPFTVQRFILVAGWLLLHTKFETGQCIIIYWKEKLKVWKWTLSPHLFIYLPLIIQDFHLSSMVGKILCLLEDLHPTREWFIFTHLDNINGEELKLLTYTMHSWPFNSEDSLACQACHTYWDTGNSVYIVHLQGHVTFTPLARRLAVTTFSFNRYDSNSIPSACKANALTDCAMAGREDKAWLITFNPCLN